MRLDKFLCEMNIGSRSQVKTYVKQGQVTVNGVTAKNADRKIDESKDIVTYNGEVLRYQKYHYYMLNKPQGVVSATQDNVSKTVLDLLPYEKRKNISPVGRLDKDTEGFLLLTDDGDLAHRLLAPAKHVEKRYLVQLTSPLSDAACKALEKGVDIGEDSLTQPARVERLSNIESQILLTIHEGKFHQVKRMLKAVGNEVTALKRVNFGALALDENLKPGEYRELTDEEVILLQRTNIK